MDFNKFVLNICRKMEVFKYIYKHKKFFAADLEAEFTISKSTIYRYLEEMCNKKLLERAKNGESNEYKITLNWLKFYLGLREELLGILLYA